MRRTGMLFVVASCLAAWSAAPPQTSYTRIYCSADGETHFDAVAVEFRRIEAAPPAPPIFLGSPAPVTRATFAAFEPRWGAHDLETRNWHAAPAAQSVVMLRGTFFITTTDGETRRFTAGDIFRVEDVAPCRGHITVAGDEPVTVLLLR